MVEPGAGFNDDHPPHHVMLGQLFIGSIHAALAQSPLWDRFLFVVSYDEAGGFFDHVPPPTTADDRASDGFDQLGFRVPAIAMGPWVKRGHASDTVFDHTSWLRHVQNVHGLDPLTARDAAANDLSSLIDEEAMASGEPPADLAELPVITLSEEQIQAECDARRTNPHTGQPELERLVRRAVPHLDRTGELADTGRFLVDEAIRLGVCRFA
jgi:phospholipase C